MKKIEEPFFGQTMLFLYPIKAILGKGQDKDWTIIKGLVHII